MASDMWGNISDILDRQKSEEESARGGSGERTDPGVSPDQRTSPDDGDDSGGLDNWGGEPGSEGDPSPGRDTSGGGRTDPGVTPTDDSMSDWHGEPGSEGDPSPGADTSGGGRTDPGVTPDNTGESSSGGEGGASADLDAGSGRTDPGVTPGELGGGTSESRQLEGSMGQQSPDDTNLTGGLEDEAGRAMKAGVSDEVEDLQRRMREEEGLTRAEYDIVREGDQLRANIAESVRRRRARRQAASDLGAEPGDVQLTEMSGGGFEASLTDEGARERASQQISEQTCVPESQFSLKRTGEGFEAMFGSDASDDGMWSQIGEELGEQAVRERVAEQQGVDAENITVEQTGGGYDVSLSVPDQRTDPGVTPQLTTRVGSEGATGEGQREQASAELERKLEQETGVELSSEDISVSQQENSFRGQLSESGQQKVAVESAPAQGIPVAEDISEAGALADYKFDQFREENVIPVWNQNTPDVNLEDEFNAATPDVGADVRSAYNRYTPDVTAEDVGKGALAAGVAGVAVPEPTTTVGGAGVATIGAGILAGAAIVGAGASIAEGRPQEQAEVQLPESTSMAELDVPGEGTQTRRELDVTAGEGPVASGELDTPESARQGEISIPNGGGRQQTEIGTFRTQELIGRQQSRQQEFGEQKRTITGEDIVTDLPDPEQEGPSVRERQRRDDLFAPGRTFPTGGSAVVGLVEAEEATRREVATEGEYVREQADVGMGVGQGPHIGAGVDQRERGESLLDSFAGADTATRTQTVQAQVPAQVTLPQTGSLQVGETIQAQDYSYPEETATPDEVVEETAYGRPGRPRKPRDITFGFGAGSEDPEQETGFGESQTEAALSTISFGESLETGEIISVDEESSRWSGVI